MFKDTRGVWITLGLFGDTATTYKDGIIWDTIKEARTAFIECGDPTGITFADKYLGGYEHWLAVRSSKGLELEITSWEEELEARIRSQALLGIKAMALDSFQASKFLMDRGWEKRGAGRPSKEAVDKETRVQSKMKVSYLNDINRIKR